MIRDGILKGQATPANDPVTIADINAKIRETNRARELAASYSGDANSLGEETTELVAKWRRQHPGKWIDFDEIEEIDEPYEIDLIDEDELDDEDEDKAGEE
jgi:hypothetical protein